MIIDRRGVVIDTDAPDTSIAANPTTALAWKAPVICATTPALGNIALEGLQTIDGIALSADQRVLVKDQIESIENGIYNVSSGPWQRSLDANQSAHWCNGTQVYVTSGATNALTVYALTSPDQVILGTSALFFTLSTTLSNVSNAMRPVVLAQTLPDARAAMGLKSLAVEDLGRYGVADDGAGFLRPSRPVSNVTTAQAPTSLNHNAFYVVRGSVAFTVPNSHGLWSGYGFTVFTPAGATATLTPDVDDAFDGQAVAAPLVINAGALVYVTTDGNGLWFATPVTGWQNIPSPIAGATTVGNQHDGLTLNLGGGAFYALTFPSGALLNPNFRCVIVNTETTPIGKGIAGTSEGPFLLYPGESYLVFNDNGTLRLLGGGVKRYKKAGIALFVDKNNGSDNPQIADGLATGTRAYKTIGAALTALFQNFDHNQSFPTVTIAAQVYFESITVAGALVGANVFFLMGSAPCGFGGAGGAFSSGVQWSPASSGTPFCLLVGDGATLEWGNIYWDGAGVTGVAIQCHQNVVVDQLGGGGFGSFGNPGGTHIGMDGCGTTYNISASYNVAGAGGAAVHISVPCVAQLNHAGGVTVTIASGAANPNIGTWCRGLGSGSNIALGASITWGGTPVAGCQKWSAGPQSLISLNGNGANVPGSVAGSPAAGNTPSAGNGMVTA